MPPEANDYKRGRSNGRSNRGLKTLHANVLGCNRIHFRQLWSGMHRVKSVSDEAQFHKWLAIASDASCAVLSQMGHPFFALSRNGAALAPKVSVGDRCVLYRAQRNQGFIGLFEITEPPKQVSTRVGMRTFSIRVPWRTLIVSEAKPVRLAPLIPHLAFITNKSRPGTYFQSSFRAISARDFTIIQDALAKATERLE